jgi:acyl carrier protein
MSTIRDRLLHCFRLVFPEQIDSSLIGATPESIERWDSSNHFLLINVAEEEFGIRIPEEIGGELLSFTSFENYLSSTIRPNEQAKSMA